MYRFGIFIFFFFLASNVQARPHSQIKVFNVRKLGAVGKGKKDDKEVFLKVWNRACQYGGHTRIVVPKGPFLVGPMKFVGPCKGPIDFQLRGTLRSDPKLNNVDHWISFQYVDQLSLFGGGTVDGQGEFAWTSSGCSKNVFCNPLPISIRFDFITSSWISDITSINSKNFHMNIFGSNDIKIEGVKILAPADSPNTDGIHIGVSGNIKIFNSVIATGDDCISMGPGSRDIHIAGVSCGPGHGISIGSLGKYPNEQDVTGIFVERSTLSGTQNGVRIKTWAPSSKSTVHNVTFERIQMNNVYQPIIIDQNYCPHNACNKQQASQVQIKDVWFKDINGSSRSEMAVTLNCSRIAPCQNVNLGDIDLDYAAGPKGGAAKSTCSYVNGASSGFQNPRACI